MGGVSGFDGFAAAGGGAAFPTANELTRVESEEGSLDLLESLELDGGLDVQVLFLHLGLELDDATDGLVHRVAHRLLESFDLDADEFDLAGRTCNSVLHLVDGVDVDTVESTCHRIDRPIDLVETSLRSGDAIAEHCDGVVEPGAHATDVGIDVGDALADGLVDARFGGQDPFVDAVLCLVDASANDIRHLGLLASGLR